TPRPGPESSVTSSSAKRSILPRPVAATTAVPVTGVTETTASPSPTRAIRRPARVVSERSGVARKPKPRAVATSTTGCTPRARAPTPSGPPVHARSRAPRAGPPRRGGFLAQEPRRHDPLAVAELEQRLHGLAVARRRGYLGDANHVDRPL